MVVSDEWEDAEEQGQLMVDALDQYIVLRHKGKLCIKYNHPVLNYTFKPFAHCSLHSLTYPSTWVPKEGELWCFWQTLPPKSMEGNNFLECKEDLESIRQVVGKYFTYESQNDSNTGDENYIYRL